MLAQPAWLSVCEAQLEWHRSSSLLSRSRSRRRDSASRQHRQRTRAPASKRRRSSKSDSPSLTEAVQHEIPSGNSVLLISANTLNSNATSRRFLSQMLAAHNEYRSAHQAPPLRHSEELTKQAQSWAESMAANDTLDYDPKCEELGIGENVARKCDVDNPDAITQEFVDTWYSEVHNFDWRSLADQFECSHFAQLVWRSSREVGFGRAVSVSGCVYIVGRYRPTGNVPGEFPKNVLPRITHKNSLVRSSRVEHTATYLSSSSESARPAPTQAPEKSQAAPSPLSAASLFGALSAKPAPPAEPEEQPAPAKISLFSALGGVRPLGSSPANSPAAQPISAAFLFKSLASKPAAVDTPGAASTKSLFGALSTRTDTIKSTRVQKDPADALEEIVPVFNIRKFISQMLVSHNDYRVQHKAPPLRLNPQLNRLAQDWADVLAMRDKMAHDPNANMVNTGENVAMKFRIGETNFTGDVFTDMWYEEIDSYDWDLNELQPECGHFTQLVWKSTSEVGFGRAVSDTGRVYVVARYRPPGNLKGEFKRNVLPSADDAAKISGEGIAKEPMRMPSPIMFSVSDFGAASKRRSLMFSAGEPPPTAAATQSSGGGGGGSGGGSGVGGGGGGSSSQPLRMADFFQLRSAIRNPGDAAEAHKSAGSSPMAAMLLRQTLQQNVRKQDTREVEEENIINIKKFETQLLVSHNEFRALHRSPPLRLNPELSKLAQAWAEVLASKDKMAHDPKCGSLNMGENVAMKFRKGFKNFPGDLFSELWYHEIDQYKWTGEDQLACGHFTQLVWRSSTEVGFGRAVSKTGRVYVVGRYRPPGNYSGQFGRNVLPPSRVMPKARNNIWNRSNHEASRKVPPTAKPGEPMEFAGFGTARVVDRTQDSKRTNHSTRTLLATRLDSPEPAKTESTAIGQKQPNDQPEKRNSSKQSALNG